MAHLRVELPEVDRSGFKKPDPKTSKRERIRGWKRLKEVETRRSMVEEEPTELLDKDKSPKAANRASKEASGASKEAQNDGEGGRRE